MRYAAAVLSLLLGFAASAWAQEQAFTNRATDLRDKGSPDAKSVSSLPQNTEVKVLSRAGAWTQVEAAGQKGWVSAFHLRFPVAVDKSSSGGSNPLTSLTSVFGGGRSEQRTTVATTGIRGLSPDELKNASPDAAALAKAKSYRADKPAAERFAREGKLASVTVDEGGRR